MSLKHSENLRIFQFRGIQCWPVPSRTQSLGERSIQVIMFATNWCWIIDDILGIPTTCPCEPTITYLDRVQKENQRGKMMMPFGDMLKRVFFLPSLLNHSIRNRLTSQGHRSHPRWRRALEEIKVNETALQNKRESPVPAGGWWFQVQLDWFRVKSTVNGLV